MLGSDDDVAIVQIEYGMEDGIVVRNVLDGPVRIRVGDALDKFPPLGSAVNVVGHEEPAAIEVIAEDLALLLCQSPFAGLDGVNEGIVVNVVSIFKVDDLFHGAGIDPRQTPDGFQKVPVSARIILGPQ